MATEVSAYLYESAIRVKEQVIRELLRENRRLRRELASLQQRPLPEEERADHAGN